MPASVPSLIAVDLEAEAAPLGPAAVHAQQHLGPVLRVDAAVLGVDLHDASASSCSPVNRLRSSSSSSCLRDRRDRRVDLGLLRLVVVLAGQLVQHLGVVELAAPSASNVSTSSCTLAYSVLTFLASVLVVPQVGAADLGSSSASRARLASIFR